MEWPTAATWSWITHTWSNAGGREMDMVWNKRKKTSKGALCGSFAVTRHSQESSLPGEKYEAIATCEFSNLLITWSRKFPGFSAIPGWLSIFFLSSENICHSSSDLFLEAATCSHVSLLVPLRLARFIKSLLAKVQRLWEAKQVTRIVRNRSLCFCLCFKNGSASCS